MNGRVRIVLELDGLERDIGRGGSFASSSSDPSENAGALAEAWREALERAERIVTLYGLEGIARAVEESRGDV